MYPKLRAESHSVSLLIIILVIILLCPTVTYLLAYQPTTSPSSSSSASSSLSLSSFPNSRIGDCCCETSTVDAGNSDELWSSLQHLRKFLFFRIFKVELHNSCPFWHEEGQCSRRGCSVCGECSFDDLPELWRIELQEKNEKTTYEDRKIQQQMDQQLNVPVDFFLPKQLTEEKTGKEKSTEENISLSIGTSKNMGAFGGWRDDESDTWHSVQKKDVSYIDMELNPEGYTGFEGFSAWRIWSAIYQENCFAGSSFDEMCFEKRVFYRLISGLHTAISTHISYYYPKTHASFVEQLRSILSIFSSSSSSSSSSENLSPSIFSDEIIEDSSSAGPSPAISPQLDIFQSRIGNHPDRIENLYFAFVFLLRAVNKVTPFLLNYNYDTGNTTEDISLKSHIHSILTEGFIPTCSAETSFDETVMFHGFDAPILRSEFFVHFQNISRIMDCVTCEKCRLHGKLQMLGLGTAVKILFETQNIKNLSLERNEVMALMVTLAKFSHAIHMLNQMKTMRLEKYSQLWITIGITLIAIVMISIWMMWRSTRSCRQRKNHKKDKRNGEHKKTH